MSLDSIKAIREAEEQAEGILKDARRKAGEIIRQAEADGITFLELTMSKTREVGESRMEQARKETLLEVGVLESENERICREIKSNAEARLQEAAVFIMGRIVNLNGHS